MNLYSISHREASSEEVERDRLFKVFVIGLPRSGTSLMTKIVKTLGVNIIATSESKKEKLDEQYKKQFGEYHPNEGGFYEITESPLAHFLEIIDRPYSGCKMIIPVMDVRFELLKLAPCKVIMMWRDPKEIKESQEAFYSVESDEAYLRTALVTQKKALEDSNIDHWIVDYRKLVTDPYREIYSVSDFILSNKGYKDAVNLVNPEKYRFRKDALCTS